MLGYTTPFTGKNNASLSPVRHHWPVLDFGQGSGHWPHGLTRSISAESIIDKAISLHAIGGVHDRQIPTSFMCLTLKLLQLQPEKEILFEYLLAEEFK